MIIGSNYYVQGSFYYSSLSIEQRNQVDQICSFLGVSVQELEFYFSFLSYQLGNINFFVFVFLLYKKPQILNNLRMINANMNSFNSSINTNFGGYFSFPSPVGGGSGGGSGCSNPSLGDAFLTAFSPQDLQKIKNGEKADLKNGIIGSIDSLKQFDKNNDGKISGDELKDLQIAVDKNKDGIIDKNELKTALDSGVKEIDLKTGKVATEDGKQFNLNEGSVNVGKGNNREDKNAVTIDLDGNNQQSKDNQNKLNPAPSPQLSDNNSTSQNNASTSNSSSSGSNGASSSSGSSSSGGGGK